MGENTHQHLPTKRIYLGEGKAEPPKPEQKKADTRYNARMQELFDVVAQEAVAERSDIVDAQGEIAMATAELLGEKKSAWEQYREHGDVKKFIHELDAEWRGRELPRKLERILIFATLGASSAGLNYAGELVAEKALKDRPGLLKRKDGSFVIPMDDADTRGNRKALTKGWEMITDSLVGSFSDVAVQQATNRDDVGFVSPLSSALSKIGTIASAVALPEGKKQITRMVNAVSNPGTIEAGIRTLASVPVLGAKVENWYIALNKRILRGSGIFPFGFEMAVTMLAAKESQMKDVETIKATKTAS